MEPYMETRFWYNRLKQQGAQPHLSDMMFMHYVSSCVCEGARGQSATQGGGCALI